MGYLVYVAEDEESIRELIKCSLESFGCTVEVFTNGQDFLEKAEKTPPEIAILDVMMPKMDGLQVLKALRSNLNTKQIGIIMVTAKSDEVDKVQGFQMGADDYLAKPFSILELNSRVGALGRRCVQNKAPLIQWLDLVVDREKREVICQGEEAHLSKKEYDLLLRLLEAKGNVVSRDELIQDVWGYDFMGESRTIDMHIKTLREKIKDRDGKKIMTIRGIGYKMKTGG